MNNLPKPITILIFFVIFALLAWLIVSYADKHPVEGDYQDPSWSYDGGA